MLIRPAVGDILPGMGEAIAILVVIDGLRADAVGAYGNDQASTPFLDRLSAESILFDFAFCLEPSLESFYASVVLGSHPYARLAGADPPRIAGRSCLAEAGSHYLSTADPRVTGRNLGGFGWTGAWTIDSVDPNARGRDGYLAFFQSAARWLNEQFGASAGEPSVGWVHTSVCPRGAPIESRQEYDLIISQLDEGIGELFESLSFPAETRRVLFAVTGARGYALGEHGEVGLERPVLHEELLHVPLIVHSTEPGQSPVRTARLTSPINLGDLVSAWLKAPIGSEASGSGFATIPVQHAAPGAAESADYQLFANSLGDQAIRTPGWYLIRKSRTGDGHAAASGDSAHELFLKPDDRWEVNEVSSRRPEIVDALSSRLDELTRQASAGERLRLPALPPELLKGS